MKLNSRKNRLLRRRLRQDSGNEETENDTDWLLSWPGKLGRQRHAALVLLVATMAVLAVLACYKESEGLVTFVSSLSSSWDTQQGGVIAATNKTISSAATAPPFPVNDDPSQLTPSLVEAMTIEQVDQALIKKGLDPLPKPQDDPWKLELFARLDRIRLLCGTLCTLNSMERIREFQLPADSQQPQLFPTVQVTDVNCPTILSMKDIDAGDLTFPRNIPDELIPFFTLNHTYHIRKAKIRKDAYLGGESATTLWKTGSVWERADIDASIQQVAEGTLKGSYGLKETNRLRDSLARIDMKGNSVLVIGSSHPWVECVCLYHGAAMVTTLEYGSIESKHPQIKTETPETFRARYLNGTLGTFDGIVTHSSLEHSGLGRYGDALNPWGDILALARAWCVTKPGAFLWLGIPTGRDMVFYNWHRVYGAKRWPLITTNWKVLEMGGMSNGTAHGARLERGAVKSMKNEGYIFEKLDIA